jgi:hypothetical protein
LDCVFIKKAPVKSQYHKDAGLTYSEAFSNLAVGGQDFGLLDIVLTV